MDLGIDSLRVLVTAGASGIGLEIVRAFAAGRVRVQFCDVDEARLDALRESGSAFRRSRCDVADRG